MQKNSKLKPIYGKNAKNFKLKLMYAKKLQIKANQWKKCKKTPN